jgi:hypothetical protein
MIKIENFNICGLEHAIRGMRNPMNSWDKSDSEYCACLESCDSCMAYDFESKMCNASDFDMSIGPNDYELMMKLAKGGPVHAKYRRMITVYMDITAPLYWWKEFDTYKVGTVANSCSTMHKIHEKKFTLEDFSCEHLIDSALGEPVDCEIPEGVTVWADVDGDTAELAITFHGHYPGGRSYKDTLFVSQKNILDMFIIPALNANRNAYLKYDNIIKNKHGSIPFDEAVNKRKQYWWQMIQLLPSSYNQKRTIMLNYEVLTGIYRWRKDHKLDEWREFCEWIEKLPYSEIITGERDGE